MEIRGLSSKKSWDYENGFYWFSPYNRIAKQIAHWELYKKILEVPGDIIEVGVFKGASLTRWGTFREISENSLSRKILIWFLVHKMNHNKFFLTIMILIIMTITVLLTKILFFSP